MPAAEHIRYKTYKYIYIYKIWGRQRTFAAAGALGRKHAMVVIDAVNLMIHIHGEGHAVQALIADAAAEAARMI